MAHPDDDLLFVNPHVEADIRAGKRVVTVLTTSGDGADPNFDWEAQREIPLRSAYAAMSNNAADVWTCASQSFGGKSPRVCSLNANPLVSVIFMRILDGHVMTVLNGGSSGTADGATTYNAAQVRAVLTAIIDSVGPGRVGTLDGSLAHGSDHDDHVATALFTFDVARNGANRQLIMYRGYTIYPPSFSPPPPQPEPENLSTADVNEKVRLMEIYFMATVTPTSDEGRWCRRFYPIASVNGSSAVLNAAGGGCLAASAASDGASVGIATCAAGTLQNWTANGNNRLTGPGGRCLGLNGNATVIEPCTGAADQNWTVMSNGQVRGSGPDCLTRSGNTVTAETCTADTSGAQYHPPTSQRWNF